MTSRLLVAALIAVANSIAQTADTTVIPVDTVPSAGQASDSTPANDYSNVVEDDTLVDFGQVDSAIYASWAVPDAPESIGISEAVSEIFLYWETLYMLPVAVDHATLIEPPAGYTIESVIVGNSELYMTSYVKNTVAIKRLAIDGIKSNMTILLSDPQGQVRSLTIALSGADSKNPVNIVRFRIPKNVPFIRAVEQLKARYKEQMEKTLKKQEEVLKASVRRETINGLRIFRFNSWQDDTEEEYKGAKFALDAVVNQGDDSFIYMSTDASDPECQVVQLLRVVDDEDEIRKAVQLVHTYKSKKRMHLVYKSSRFPDKDDRDWIFKIKIWSKEFEIETPMRLGGYYDAAE